MQPPVGQSLNAFISLIRQSTMNENQPHFQHVPLVSDVSIAERKPEQELKENKDPRENKETKEIEAALARELEVKVAIFIDVLLAKGQTK